MRLEKYYVIGTIVFVALLGGSSAFGYSSPPKNEKIPKHQILVQDLDIMQTLKTPIHPEEFDFQVIVRELLSEIDRHRDWIGGLSLDQIKEDYKMTEKDDNGIPYALYVKFVQMFEGMEVQGSYLVFTIELSQNKGKILYANMRIFPYLKINDPVNVPENEILNYAAQNLNIDLSKTSLEYQKKEVRYLQGRWRRMAIVKFKDKKDILLVDLKDGRIWLQNE